MDYSFNNPAERWALINLGGTIGEIYDHGGVLSRVDGCTLLKSAELPAHWPTYDVALIDSAELTFQLLFKVRDVIAKDKQSRGFIICCGTDLMDEVAYAASLILPIDRPIVFTAAALPCSVIGSDGVANLRRAAQLVASIEAPAIVVVMGDDIFDPLGLVKLDSQAMQPFTSQSGVVGRFRADRAVFTRLIRLEDKFRGLSYEDCMARVAILTECIGGVDRFIDPKQLDGLVVAGAGAGGLSSRTLNMLRRDYLPYMPVVLSTRCPFGFSINPDIAKYALQIARDEGFIVEEFTHLNALHARIRLVLHIAQTGNGVS